MVLRSFRIDFLCLLLAALLPSLDRPQREWHDVTIALQAAVQVRCRHRHRCRRAAVVVVCKVIVVVVVFVKQALLSRRRCRTTVGGGEGDACDAHEKRQVTVTMTKRQL